MWRLKAVLIGALAAAVRSTFAQEFDLGGRGDCSANDEDGARKGTCADALGSNTVVEMIGGKFLKTPHPRFKVEFVHLTNDEGENYAVKLKSPPVSLHKTCARTGNKAKLSRLWGTVQLQLHVFLQRTARLSCLIAMSNEG